MNCMDIDSYIRTQADQSGNKLFSHYIGDEVKEFIAANESFQNIEIGQGFEFYSILFLGIAIMGYAFYLLSL